jgi:hypothetical protein
MKKKQDQERAPELILKKKKLFKNTISNRSNEIQG